MLHTKYPGSMTRRFLKFSLRESIFSSFDLVMQWIGTILTIIKDGHLRTIPAKFDQNSASNLGGDGRIRTIPA